MCCAVSLHSIQCHFRAGIYKSGRNIGSASLAMPYNLPASGVAPIVPIPMITSSLDSLAPVKIYYIVSNKIKLDILILT